MRIYVFAGNDGTKKARNIGLSKGLAIFGWGFDSQYDLNKDGENPYYGKVKFLKNIEIGDKIIYVNHAIDKAIEDSHYGWCTIMDVTGSYEFNEEILNECKDFGHTIKVNPATAYSFHRNSESIHPSVSKSLKPRKAYHQLYCVDKLIESINNSKNNYAPNYFEKELNEGLAQITATIQSNHHDKNLEDFLKPLFEKNLF